MTCKPGTEVKESDCLYLNTSRNGLYVGHKNTVMIDGYSGEPGNLELRLADQTILSYEPLKFFVRVEQRGEYNIEIRDRTSSEILLSQSMMFKDLPMEASLNVPFLRGDGKIPKPRLATLKQVYCNATNSGLEVNFKVQSFSILGIVDGHAQVAKAKGNEINEQQRSIINQLSSGDHLIVKDIHVQSLTGQVVVVDPLVHEVL